MTLRAYPKCLIGAVALAATWGRHAHADTPAAPPSNETGGETSATKAADNDGLSDEDRKLRDDAERSAIYVNDRYEKPFERDTQVRLTGEQLAQRGAVDLATALALLPDVSVRDAGRGGFNIDIRGARKGAVSVIVDGVLVSDPYYGTFDVSTIPVTDIIEIRVATTPQSPIDGPGGPGGVIEVVTRDALGPKAVIARVTGDSLPSFGMTGTARVALAKDLALRLSASGLMGARDMALPNNASLGEERRAVTGAMRLEYRKGTRRLALDGFLDNRHYISPPSDVNPSSILLIDGETTSRVTLKANDKVGDTALQGQGWFQTMGRTSRYYSNASLSTQQAFEELSATRVGGQLLATRAFAKHFRWAAATSFTHETAEVKTQGDVSTGNVTLVEPAADLQFDRKKIALDAAFGVALPIGVGADPWPEMKLVGKYRATKQLDITATGGRKGRLPSLRERFDAATGNPALGPEKAWHAEVRATHALDDRLRIEVAPYYRRTQGTVRVSTNPADMGKLANLGELDIYGIDTSARAKVIPELELGGSYNYIIACQLGSAEGCDRRVGAAMGGLDPLDRLPHHRFDAWARALPRKGYTALVRARYLGGSRDQGNTTDGYMLVEASASAQVTRDYLGVLRIDDLLDRRPETRSGFHGPGRVISLIFQGSWQ
ncbi:MAG: TonB-dependent receptor [Deltaproteobacteria bacterium]|nr:TonB-dependent receptor [Deltaproteobacteria bacterium]